MSATLSALEKAKAIAAKLSNGYGVGNIDAKNDTFGDSGVSQKRKRSDADEDGREKNHFEGAVASNGGSSAGSGSGGGVPGTYTGIGGARWAGREQHYGGGVGGGGGEIEETITVPNGVIGYVIGRGGESIKNIQSVTGCNVQIQREQDMAPGR